MIGPSADLTDPWNSDLSEVLFVCLGLSADLTDPWNSDFSEVLFVCHKDLISPVDLTDPWDSDLSEIGFPSLETFPSGCITSVRLHLLAIDHNLLK